MPDRERYLPTPVWNVDLSRWEAIDFHAGQTIVAWPEDFDTARLPIPAYCDGDRVQFVRDETCAREGVVRMVMLRGGTYGPLDRVEDMIASWYCDRDNIAYIVTARGHDHRIHEWNIVGRFVRAGQPG